MRKSCICTKGSTLIHTESMFLYAYGAGWTELVPLGCFQVKVSFPHLLDWPKIGLNMLLVPKPYK